MTDEAPTPSEERPRRRWRLPFTWLGLLALGWVLYETTHQPALAAVALCLKFGWEDFAAARWLYRVDPDVRRARACCWLYFAWGLWKTAAVAFLMSVGFALAVPRGGPAPAGPAAALLAFLGTFLTTIVALAVSSVSTGCAVMLGWVGGQRLWLDSAVHHARTLECWPPSVLCEGRRNRFDVLLITSLAVWFMVAVVVLLVVVPGVGFLLSVTSPVALLLAREVVSRQVRATTPQECWGLEDGEADLS
jgi:hypothetical protein